jgi:hypothetical protein
VNTLTALVKPTPDPFSSSTPYNPERPESSKSTSFPPNHFLWDPRPPRVEVNKFDGSDPTSWVTQMELYFSLYNITDDLAKLRYGVLHLDLERWQWWKWRKNARQGYLAWTHFFAELYERFDVDTNHLGRLTKLKQYGIVEDFIAAFSVTSFPHRGNV